MTRSIVGFTRISLVAEWRSAEIRIEAGLSKLPELWGPFGDRGGYIFGCTEKSCHGFRWKHRGCGSHEGK